MKESGWKKAFQANGSLEKAGVAILKQNGLYFLFYYYYYFFNLILFLNFT